MMTIDRIDFATRLSENARVLDIGGQKMEGCDPKSAFAIKYGLIEKSAHDYRIVDYQPKPSVDYIVNFNEPDSIGQIRDIITGYRPEVILCMETLEHINYHYELMNELARSVETHGSLVFITVPNNGNWVLNVLGWNHDHSLAFFRDIAHRFVERSNLGQHEVLVAPCMQKYLWYWRIVYGLSIMQPLSWGFLITPKGYQPYPAIEPVISALRTYTTKRFKPRTP